MALTAFYPTALIQTRRCCAWWTTTKNLTCEGRRLFRPNLSRMAAAIDWMRAVSPKAVKQRISHLFPKRGKFCGAHSIYILLKTATAINKKERGIWYGDVNSTLKNGEQKQASEAFGATQRRVTFTLRRLTLLSKIFWGSAHFHSKNRGFKFCNSWPRNAPGNDTVVWRSTLER